MTQEISLPPIVFGPKQFSVGTVSLTLRDKETVAISSTGQISVSPRIKEPQFFLASGEKIVVTTRRNCPRPPGIDGVLLKSPEGDLSWLSHQAADEFQHEIVLKGWSEVLAELAKEWPSQFRFKTELPSADGRVKPANRGLRPPQIGALHAIGAHWSLSDTIATIVMPTGTGKTETIISALLAYPKSPMLVVVPSDALRKQTAEKFETLGLLRYLNVIPENTANPIVGALTKVPKQSSDLEIFDHCHVMVTTMSCLNAKAAHPFWPEIVKRVGVLVLDEAHHVGAKGWSQLRETFKSKPILQFTATPFRRDGHVVDGEVIFSYPLRAAQADKYFKPIHFEPVYEASPNRADQEIAVAALARLRSDIESGYDHLLMARCENIGRATEIFSIYAKLAPDLRPTLVHSKRSDAQDRIDDLITRRSRIAVCVNMLGEGFDLPQLKIAAIHDLHKSLAILLQFTGRFTRSAAPNIGDATVVANIAEPKVSVALERLYSEDADWNELLSEMSSEAANDHARLTKFLNESHRLDTNEDDEISISHKLLRPTLNTVVYKATKWSPRKFHEALPDSLVPQQVWLHDESNTLFFVTRSEPKVTWTRSKAVKDRIWTLFILHYDEKRGLLYFTSTDKKNNFEKLAKKVGATTALHGDVVFRSLGRINRLIFQNLGLKKHGRRNLSYASYTGAEVTEALGLAEKHGSIKAMLSGMGWEDGKPVTIGCSAKGRIWSREQGAIPRLNEWCELVGDKLLDSSIDTTKLIDNVLLPTEVTRLPDVEPLSIEWPVELIRQQEDRVDLTKGQISRSLATFELAILQVIREENSIDFELTEALTGSWAQFRFRLGGSDKFSVFQRAGDPVSIRVGQLTETLEDYLSYYPPLFRFADLSELDANLHIVPQTPYDLTISDSRFEAWDWKGVDIRKESMWKDGVLRGDSIQSHVAEKYLQSNFDVVFDDDSAGEAADLVCIRIDDDKIRVDLIHCKFSGSDTPGERVKDVVEVAAQAIRSARWSGKLPQLFQHLRTRDASLKHLKRSTRFLKGSASDLSRITKISRFLPIHMEILVVQPGLSKQNRSNNQSSVLGAALTYLKETIGVDLQIICSE